MSGKGVILPRFELYSHCSNLLKMQIPKMGVFAHSIQFCFATSGVCVLCALTSVGALFLLKNGATILYKGAPRYGVKR